MIGARPTHTFDNPFKKCLCLKNRERRTLLFAPYQYTTFLAQMQEFFEFYLVYTEKSFYEVKQILFACFIMLLFDVRTVGMRSHDGW